MKLLALKLTFFVVLVSLLNPSCKKDPVVGCTNPKAENYDPKADTDGGDCIVKGCTNPKALNYDPEATVDDGFCLVKGCTNPKAENYNPEANVDNDSCIIKGCTNPTALNYDQEANVDDGSCLFENSKFIGRYVGKLVCMNQFINNAVANQDIIFIFEEISGDNSKVKMRLESTVLGNQDLIGEINGNKLNYSAPEQSIDIDINMDGTPESIKISNSGVFTTFYPEPKLEGVINIKVSLSFQGLPIAFEDSCTMTAIKQ